MGTRSVVAMTMDALIVASVVFAGWSAPASSRADETADIADATETPAAPGRTRGHDAGDSLQEGDRHARTASRAAAPGERHVPIELDSGHVTNHTSARGVVWAGIAAARDASSFRLFFSDATLGTPPPGGAPTVLRITSLVDGAQQHHTARTLRQWRLGTAYFNGSAALIEIIADPGAGPSRVQTDVAAIDLRDGELESICGGTDERQPTDDLRVGRLSPILCTSWLIDDPMHCLLTAGHCLSGAFVIEFNVPPSLPDGTRQHPPPSEQYAIDPDSKQGFDGAVGDDWGYFGAFPNTETQLTPGQAQGAWFELADAAPDATDAVRLTGFGLVFPPGDLTMNGAPKTNVGLYGGREDATTVLHAADTSGGSSGSPINDAATGRAIGIHTHAGCDPFNHGTAIDHPDLQWALANPLGACRPVYLVLAPPDALPEVIAPGMPTTVALTIQNGLERLDPKTARLFVDRGDDLVEVPMTAVGDRRFEGDLPAMACGARPRYWFQAATLQGTVVQLPEAAPRLAFETLVGTATIAYASDFEEDDGWVTEVLGATSGAWDRGVPVNDPEWNFAPLQDADGSGRCFLTQNEPGNTDVDGGAVRLTSPPIDMTGGHVVLSWAWFLRLTVSVHDDRLLVELEQADGTWVEIARHDVNGGLDWYTARVGSDELAAAGIQVGPHSRLRFTAVDTEQPSVVEAGVDGVRVMVVACHDPCGADLDGSGAVDAADLLAVLAAWGSGEPVADIDGDGAVGVGDLLAVLGGWGDCPARP